MPCGAVVVVVAASCSTSPLACRTGMPNTAARVLPLQTAGRIYLVVVADWSKQAQTYLINVW